MRRSSTPRDQVGARVWVVSEYGHVDVSRPILLNRVLREAGFSERPAGTVRRDPRHVRQPGLRRLRPPARPRLCRPADDRVHVRERLIGDCPASRESWRATSGARSGWTIRAPATWSSCRKPIPGSPIRTGSTTAWPPISRGPSTSTASPATTPASCSSTQACCGPRAGRSRRLSQKKLGFRTLFDVIPLDPRLVRGSHGVPAPGPRIARS